MHIKNFSLALACLAVAITLAACKQSAPANMTATGSTTYTDSTAGFSIVVPNSWHDRPDLGINELVARSGAVAFAEKAGAVPARDHLVLLFAAGHVEGTRYAPNLAVATDDLSGTAFEAWITKGRAQPDPRRDVQGREAYLLQGYAGDMKLLAIRPPNYTLVVADGQRGWMVWCVGTADQCQPALQSFQFLTK
ncbi:MAG: hypothetical protein HY261_09395 [Chloroflexi bacterium]|nr:hypothetical protein [Chloroflexota bacterium]